MIAIKETAPWKHYQAYKESKVEWIGLTPESWSLVPIRAIFAERRESNEGPKTEFILSVTRDRGVIPYDEKGNIGNKKSDDIERYKVVHEKDLVINKMNVVIGSLGLSKYHGALSQVYIILSPRRADYKIRFLSYLFRNEAFYKSLIKYCKGIMALRESLDPYDFKKLELPIPSISEQTAIANFLDEKTAKIDEAIRQKERMIELLKERKQIIIQNAVTKGLDPNVPMKDSGIEWIGEIPAHWEVRFNRSLFREKKAPGKDGLPILSVSIHSGVSDDELDDESNVRGKVRIADKTSYRGVSPGDVTYNMMRAWQGGIGCVRTEGMVSPAYVVATPLGEFLESRFFELQYRLPVFIEEMNRASKGITDFRKRLYWQEFKGLNTIVPPFEEQVEISDYIGTISRKYEEASDRYRSQITKLREYRATLIDSAVTGKIDVSDYTPTAS